MHFFLYVCLPVEEAKTSLQARRRACRYLEKEHFVSVARFCGHCDCYSVGGRYSGMLTLLRLKGATYRESSVYSEAISRDEKRRWPLKLFKKCFPNFGGRIPVGRFDVEFDGYEDDAQLMTRFCSHN